jgi:hypothetical protein
MSVLLILNANTSPYGGSVQPLTDTVSGNSIASNSGFVPRVFAGSMFDFNTVNALRANGLNNGLMNAQTSWPHWNNSIGNSSQAASPWNGYPFMLNWMQSASSRSSYIQGLLLDRIEQLLIQLQQHLMAQLSPQQQAEERARMTPENQQASSTSARGLAADGESNRAEARPAAGASRPATAATTTPGRSSGATPAATELTRHFFTGSKPLNQALIALQGNELATQLLQFAKDRGYKIIQTAGVTNKGELLNGRAVATTSPRDKTVRMTPALLQRWETHPEHVVKTLVHELGQILTIEARRKSNPSQPGQWSLYSQVFVDTLGQEVVRNLYPNSAMGKTSFEANAADQLQRTKHNFPGRSEREPALIQELTRMGWGPDAQNALTLLEADRQNQSGRRAA